MLKNNLKKILVCLIVIAVLLLTIKTSFATNSSDNGDIFNKLSGLNSADGENIQSGNRVNENGSMNINTNTAKNNTAENTPKTTPYTGIDNGATIVFIGIFVVSAVYAFIRVKKYDI